MLVKTVRRPGERGTQKLLERFGKRLVCVRYCYDPVKRKKYKTVELIIQETDWVPDFVSPTLKDLPRPRRLGVQVGYHERNLREQVKAGGGRWSATEMLWWVLPAEVERLGLESRVVKR